MQNYYYNRSLPHLINVTIYNLWIRESPLYCKAQSHNWQLQLNQTGLLESNCLTGQ